MTTLISIDEARRRLESGEVVLVDIREASEHAREHIPGARHVPLSQLDAARLCQQLPAGSVPVFHCQSGQRTRMNAVKLAACVPGECFVLEGGLNAWKQAG